MDNNTEQPIGEHTIRFRADLDGVREELDNLFSEYEERVVKLRAEVEPGAPAAAGGGEQRGGGEEVVRAVEQLRQEVVQIRNTLDDMSTLMQDMVFS